MHIEGPQAGQVQDRLLQHVAIIARKQKIRLQAFQDVHEGGVVGVFGLINREIVPKSQLPHRGEPDFFPGIVRMGDHRHDLIPQAPAQLDKGLQAGVADIVVTHEDEAHI